MPTITPPSVDTYIAGRPEPVQTYLKNMRQINRSLLPDSAQEVISYSMPCYKFHGFLVYFGGAKEHVALYPANSTMIGEMKDELKDYKTSKGTIRFSLDKPLPVELITKIVQRRMAENIAADSNKKYTQSTK